VAWLVTIVHANLVAFQCLAKLINNKDLEERLDFVAKSRLELQVVGERSPSEEWVVAR